MYLADLLPSLRRRWWAVSLGLLATLGLGYMALTLVPIEYVARSSMLLLPPESTLETTSNPYLGLGGLQPAADVLSRALNDGAVHEALAPRDGTATFTVDRDTTSSGPLVLVEVTDVSSTGAAATLDAVVAEMHLTLKKLQEEVGVPEIELIDVVDVARDMTPEPDNKTQIRAILVAVALGLGGTLFGTDLLDGWLVRRRQGRMEGQAAEASSSDHTVDAGAGDDVAGPASLPTTRRPDNLATTVDEPAEFDAAYLEVATRTPRRADVATAAGRAPSAPRRRGSLRGRPRGRPVRHGEVVCRPDSDPRPVAQHRIDERLRPQRLRACGRDVYPPDRVRRSALDGATARPALRARRHVTVTCLRARSAG